MLIRGWKVQALAVCLAQGLSTATYTFLFPSIAAYILTIGVPPHKVSTIVGLAEGVQSMAELVATPLHVMAVERVPHRPLSIFTLLAPGILVGVFGMCKHVWQILLLRALMGLCGLGGLQAIIMGGLVNNELAPQGLSFSWLTMANSLGSMSGAGLSGYLAEPSGRVPLLGTVDLFQEEPYLLPGLVIFGVSILASAMVFVFVPETNESHLSSDAVDVSVDSTSPQPLPYSRLMSSPWFWSIVLVNFTQKMCSFGSMALMSSAGKLPPALGGIGMSVQQIGQILFATPLIVAGAIFVFFPPLDKRLSSRQIVILASVGCVILPLYFPIASWVSTSNHGALVFVNLIWFTGQVLARLWWIMQSTLMLRLYPHTTHRGRASVLLQQSENLAMAIGAPSYGRIFEFSSGYPLKSTGRQTIWVWAAIVSCTAVFTSYKLKVVSGPDPVTFTFDDDADEERRPILA